MTIGSETKACLTLFKLISLFFIIKSISMINRNLPRINIIVQDLLLLVGN